MSASNRPSLSRPSGSGCTQDYVQAMAACNAGAVAVIIANTEESFCVMTADADVPIPVVQVTPRAPTDSVAFRGCLSGRVDARCVTRMQRLCWMAWSCPSSFGTGLSAAGRLHFSTEFKC